MTSEQMSASTFSENRDAYRYTPAAVFSAVQYKNESDQMP